MLMEHDIYFHAAIYNNTINWSMITILDFSL